MLREGVRADLFSQESCEFRLAVSQRRDSNTGREIQVPAVLHVPQPRAFTLDKDGRRACVRRHHVRRMFLDYRGRGRIRARIRVRKSCFSLHANANQQVSFFLSFYGLSTLPSLTPPSALSSAGLTARLFFFSFWRCGEEGEGTVFSQTLVDLQ